VYIVKTPEYKRMKKFSGAHSSQNSRKNRVWGAEDNSNNEKGRKRYIPEIAFIQKMGVIIALNMRKVL